jgi:hypothetical protein
MENTPFDAIPKKIRDEGASRTTVSNLRPGAMCSLMYKNKVGTGRNIKNKPLTVLVVSNSRSGLGSAMYTHRSKKGTQDKYLSCFLIDHLQYETLSTIKTSINKYRKKVSDGRKAKSYKYVKSLFGLIIGRDKYRTLSITEGSVGSVIRYDLEYYQKALEDGRRSVTA